MTVKAPFCLLGPAVAAFLSAYLSPLSEMLQTSNKIIAVLVYTPDVCSGSLLDFFWIPSRFIHKVNVQLYGISILDIGFWLTFALLARK